VAEPVAKPHALSLLEMDASVQSVGNWASLKPADAPNELYCMAERRPVAGIPRHRYGVAVSPARRRLEKPTNLADFSGAGRSLPDVVVLLSPTTTSSR